MSKKLTIVLPAHNEAGNLERVAVSLMAIRDQIAYDLAIVIVNDGSSDGTGHVCRKLSDQHPSIRCIHHSRNIGYGGAVISGLRASEGDYVVLMDADGQFAVSDLTRLLAYIKSFDGVVGYRMHRADPLGRRILGRVWSMIGRWCFKIPIRDLNCGLKVFKRSIIEGLPLRCLGPGINLEIMTQIVMEGIPIKEVPCSHFPRTAGRQSGGSLRVISRALPELAHVWRWSRKKGS